MEYLKRNRVCHHDKVTPEVDFAYCPDCGELIENQWFIMRCACCGVKVKAMIKNGEIVAEEKFCHNCGSSIYTIDKIDKINFIESKHTAIREDLLKGEIAEKAIHSELIYLYILEVYFRKAEIKYDFFANNIFRT